ncbi:MAG: hypothetical protein H6867_00835 [Rhodospirillales bacterium]|nr:hypothetical protein [Rhodospirillales bacterium]MCB9996795.1 hypothetical protein [Rhodospirillales bacterium]
MAGAMFKKVKKMLGLDAFGMFGLTGALAAKTHELSQKQRQDDVPPPEVIFSRRLQELGFNPATGGDAVQKDATVLMAILADDGLKAAQCSAAQLSQRQVIVLVGMCAGLCDVFFQLGKLSHDSVPVMLKDVFTVIFAKDGLVPPLPLDTMVDVAMTQFGFAAGREDLLPLYAGLGNAVYEYLVGAPAGAKPAIAAAFTALLSNPVIEPVYEDQVSD